MTVAEAAAAIGAEVLGDPSPVFESVCTDTRQAVAGALFFALAGENSDGHQYVARAFSLGAVAAVVARPEPTAGGVQLLVSDTLRALGELAAAHRRRFDLPVLGVTGSVGKTSTRDLAAHVLEALGPALVSEHNYNNEIGVPATLFRLEHRHRLAVVEMAMRGPGQIDWLARLAAPSMAVITNIGMSHIELLGSRDAIAAAKSELLQALPEDGLAVLPADDDFYEFLRRRCRCRTVSYGRSDQADYRLTDDELDSSGTPSFRVNGWDLRVGAVGVHHALNAAATCALASHLGVDRDEIARRLASFRSPRMRMEAVEAPCGALVINDSYNAAPDSMRAALLTALSTARAKGRPAVAVLGDMRELGAFSSDGHRYVGSLPEVSQLRLLVTVGDAAEEIGRTAFGGAGSSRWIALPDTDTACAVVGDLVSADDVVLVKGSRALRLERVVQRLTEARQ